MNENKLSVSKFNYLAPILLVPGTLASFWLYDILLKGFALKGLLLAFILPVCCWAGILLIAMNFLISKQDERVKIFTKTLLIVSLLISIYFLVVFFFVFAAGGIDVFLRFENTIIITAFSLITFFAAKALAFKAWARKGLLCSLLLSLLTSPFVAAHSFFFLKSDFAYLAAPSLLFSIIYPMVWLISLVALFLKPVRVLFANQSSEIKEECPSIVKKYALLSKALAPYFAVGIFWCIFKNAWLAILTYHLQILLWNDKSTFDELKPFKVKYILLALPTIVAGLLLYILLPYISHVELETWLSNYQLSSLSILVLIPYFGLIHPLFEQLHWSKLRKASKLSHFMFAGYHMIVLASLLKLPWLILCFVLLTLASFIWQKMENMSKTLAVPVLSHILADFGVILVTYLVTKPY